MFPQLVQWAWMNIHPAMNPRGAHAYRVMLHAPTIHLQTVNGSSLMMFANGYVTRGITARITHLVPQWGMGIILRMRTIHAQRAPISRRTATILVRRQPTIVRGNVIRGMVSIMDLVAHALRVNSGPTVVAKPQSSP